MVFVLKNQCTFLWRLLSEKILSEVRYKILCTQKTACDFRIAPRIGKHLKP